jgi:triosephosphate isomerase
MPFIQAAAKLAGTSVNIGAQTVSRYTDHKSTGESSAKAVESAGASYTLVGHSERRAMGQTNEQVMEEVEAALEAKLLVILCVGEDERDASGSHFAAIEEQLRASLPKLTPKDAKLLIVAYEPVWAIGKTAADAMTPGDLEETAIFLRKVLAEVIGRTQALNVPILYGGSVEPDNAEYLMHAGVSGFLVGHASIEAASLLAIAKAASKVAHKTNATAKY